MPRFPPAGSQATGWIVIVPVIPPLATIWLIKLPPPMIWPARPEPLASMRVVVSMGTGDEGDVVT